MQVRICDICKKNYGEPHSFLNGESWFDGHKNSAAYETFDLCDPCMASLLRRLAKGSRALELEICKLIQTKVKRS